MSKTERIDSTIADFRFSLAGRRFRTLLADPPRRFMNRTGEMAPKHRRLARCETLSTPGIAALPVAEVVDATAHLHLRARNALLPKALSAMAARSFGYKTNLIRRKISKDGVSDGRGVGFYFRNATEMLQFGIRGANARTLASGGGR